MQIQQNFELSGGRTGVNIFHTHGIQAICVGTGDFNAHTTREHVVILEMEKAAKLCELLVKRIYS